MIVIVIVVVVVVVVVVGGGGGGSFDIILIQIFKKMPSPVKSGLSHGGLWRLVCTVTYELVRYTVCIPNIIL